MHRARRSLGQNFLVDPNLQKKIVDALDATTEDEVLEIGPGTGALTNLIAGTVRHLYAVELDRDLGPALRARFADRQDVTIIEADILDVRLASLTDRFRNLIVAGNIPYNITSPILFHLLDRSNRPARIVLMVQREVAERITAPPGSSDYGALSVGVQAVASVEKLFVVGRNAFRPVPGVDSMVVRITPVRPPNMSEQEELDLRELTRTSFNWRRKQLQRTLRDAPAYSLTEAQARDVALETGIDLVRRPETLAPDEFLALARRLRLEQRPIRT